MGKRNIRAQATIELLVLSGMFLILFIVMLSIIIEKGDDVERQKKTLLGEDLATKIQKEIQLAARSLDGYFRQFEIPEGIMGEYYELKLEGNEIIVQAQGQDFWRIIPPVTGDIRKGTNNISKKNGIIYIN